MECIVGGGPPPGADRDAAAVAGDREDAEAAASPVAVAGSAAVESAKWTRGLVVPSGGIVDGAAPDGVAG